MNNTRKIALYALYVNAVFEHVDTVNKKLHNVQSKVGC